MVSVGVSRNIKTNIFFINPQKTKVDQNCYIDLLKTSLLPKCRRHYPGNDWFPARQCSVTPRKSDETVYKTEHSRLHSYWWISMPHHIIQIIIL